MAQHRTLNAIDRKIKGGERLSFEDGLALFRWPDLADVGRLADDVRRRLHGRRATYVINRQINPTNICRHSCPFCRFAVRSGDPRAYALTPGEIAARLPDDIREVHIAGGLNPRWRFEDYLGVVRTVRKHRPRAQIKAYTAVEIDFFAEMEGLPPADILERLQREGVSCLPGGGAEVFSERVQRVLFPEKIGAERWLDIHRQAHRLGLRSNATLLFGHIETPEERVEHLLKLRALQDETQGFLSFVPLAFQPGDGRIVKEGPGAADRLKTVAVARLLLDNIPHIKAYWASLGEDIASLALHFGADDLDGTIGEEQVMHRAGARSPVSLARERLVELIRRAGFEPVERNALHEIQD
jgi:aminodeoxyfutalosine synthase